MIRYTTPSLTMTVKDVDLTGEHVWVTIADRGLAVKVTVENPTVVLSGDDSVITVNLTQAQTALFPAGIKVFAQVNYMTALGARHATSINEIEVTQNLLDVELSYA